MVPPFWERLRDHGSALALLDVRRDVRLTYRALARAIDETAEGLARRDRQLILFLIDNSVEDVVVLLAALRAGHCPFLVSPAAGWPAVQRLVHAYQPDMLIWTGGSAPVDGTWTAPSALRGQVQLATAEIPSTGGLHPSLGLMLSTSGSMGDPKAVRLSTESLLANARQIVSALDIRSEGRGALCLPLAYAYGLSVLTSHLSAGAALSLHTLSVLDRRFWNDCIQAEIDTLPAVTFTLEALADFRRRGLALPTLRRVTHAGGRLSRKASDGLHAEAVERSVDVFRMYGMTEAVARLAVSPAEEFLAHPDSVGRAVPGGAFDIDHDGQIIYRGPNVMLGYAAGRADLSRGDELNGRLETGDAGRLDSSGRLQITGRLRRFAKILGLRLNLADMEHYLSGDAETAIVTDDQRLVVYHTLGEAGPSSVLRAGFCSAFKLPAQLVEWRQVERLPRSDGGKILYSQLSC